MADTRTLFEMLAEHGKKLGVKAEPRHNIQPTEGMVNAQGRLELKRDSALYQASNPNPPASSTSTPTPAPAAKK